MADYTPRILELLTYIEEVEKLKRKPTFVIPSEFFVSHQAEMLTYPGVLFDLKEPHSEVWLRVPRLQETTAPAMPSALMLWVEVSRSLDLPPSLKPVPPDFAELLTAEGTVHEWTPNLEELLKGYIETQWQPWSTEEKKRRGTISLYNKLFLLFQSMSSDGAEDPIELVWGLGVASWKKRGTEPRVEHPLLTQACEIRLNPQTFALDISPRQIEPKLELQCYVEMGLTGVLALEALWKQIQATQALPVNPFDIVSFEPVLQAAVGQLDPEGSYARFDPALQSAPSEQLSVTSAWVVFARKRSGDVFLQDITRLKSSIEAGAEMPAVLTEFVSEGASAVAEQADVKFRGMATSATGPDVCELYFPMPYNEEQVSIARKLQNSSGVVVQGPPGTGKTHTIANVICHYLAQGKRVLVTSKGESALAVLQDKLPARIRPLSVALLSDEKDGMRQFEHSIAQIASEVSTIRPDELQAKIESLECELNELHCRIAAVDQTIAQDAEKNLQRYRYDENACTAEELAQAVVEGEARFKWFDDVIPEVASEAAAINGLDLAQLLAARAKLQGSLRYQGLKLPVAAQLPSWDVLKAMHSDLVRAKVIDKQVESGAVMALANSTLETFKHAEELLASLANYLSLQQKLAGAGAELCTRLRATPENDALTGNFRAFKPLMDGLDETRKSLIPAAIELAEGAEETTDVVDAVARLATGKSAFALPFGKGEARRIIGAIRVAGAVPTSEGWLSVKTLIEWRLSAKKELSRYNAVATEFELQINKASLELGVKSARAQLETAEQACALVYGLERTLSSKIAEVFGYSVASVLEEDYTAKLSHIIESLRAQLDKGRLENAQGQLNLLLSQNLKNEGEISDQLRDFLQNQIGVPLKSDDELRSAWLALTTEVSRLSELEPAFSSLAVHAAKLYLAAPKWAHRLVSIAAPPGDDLLIPENWREALAWRQASTLLDSLDVYKALRLKFAQRLELTDKLAVAYENLVAERAWLGVYKNSPPNIRQALQGYLASVQAMGAGTGLRAIRHRKNAREAMIRAYQAVPCWVLPHWRVSETLPAEMGLFDLVVVDEASQSDIWALPALMRGKKLLIVGDHKQVSPSVVGMPEQKIVDIQNRFLKKQPHGSYMTPDSSIYDLARVVFAGNSVMLKEHFRCAPAIIEYSNREFYEGEIRPLRVPLASQRMDPPLIDVFVNGGYRKGDRNLPEAQAIVDEIAAIIREPSNTARTIGVVTLLGIEQSKLITELIYKQIAPESVQKHKLVVGAPPMFQGRERDIMLVSMVLQQGDKTAANSLGQQQRFNVALSRARERTYLFRSVADGSFGADTLSGRLMQHFKSPFRHDPRVVEKLRDLCESGFEESMFDELVKRGYKVQPQVPCGGYRIDFVVEGQNGRRLAVECDGDRFHGPNQWSADMARQRVLERAGWVFWRCFASSFVRRKSDVMADLVSTLQGLGIEPIEHEEQTQPAWTERREVGPLSGNTVQPELPVSSAAVQTGESVQFEQSEQLEPTALTFSS